MIDISSLSFTGVLIGPLLPAPLAAAWNFQIEFEMFFFYSMHTVHLLCFVAFLRDATVSGVDVVLEELVLAEGGGADRALVRQVSRLQRLAVVLRHVVQQLPLVNLIHKNWVRSEIATRKENVL